MLPSALKKRIRSFQFDYIIEYLVTRDFSHNVSTYNKVTPRVCLQNKGRFISL